MPLAGYHASGPEHGPFSPAEFTYTIRNTGKQPLAWSASATAKWVSFSQDHGNLRADESVGVRITMNSAATSLDPRFHGPESLIFLSETGRGAYSIRPITLSIGQPKRASPQTALGINLSFPGYWGKEWPFANVFRIASSGAVVHTTSNAAWSGPPITFRSDGYPEALPRGCSIDFIICDPSLGAHFPGGKYRLFFDGQGKIRLTGTAHGTYRSNGSVVTIKPKASTGLYLFIDNTNAANPLHNIRLVPDSLSNVYNTEPFHPLFLDMLEPFGCLRFAQWQHTNDLFNIAQTAWSERPLPKERNARVTIDCGMPLEYMIELANQLKTAPWFCIPHTATSDYIRQFAQMVRDRLDPRLKCYIEFSNECWNWSRSYSPQTTKCYEDGIALYGLQGAAANAAGYGHNACRMFRIFDDVFDEPHLRTERTSSRLVRVIAWQNCNEWYMRRNGLSLVPTAIDPTIRKTVADHADVYAVAPYFGDAGGQAYLATIIKDHPEITAADFCYNGIQLATGALTKVTSGSDITVAPPGPLLLEGTRVTMTSGPASGQGQIVANHAAGKPTSPAKLTLIHAFSPPPQAGDTYTIKFSLIDDIQRTVAYFNDPDSTYNKGSGMNALRSNKKVADEFGLRLTAYEGGAAYSFSGTIEGLDWWLLPAYAEVVRFHLALHRSKEMGNIMKDYFDLWKASGGNEFVYYHNLGWPPNTQCGLSQYQDDAPRTGKYLGVANWGVANPAWWNHGQKHKE